MRLCIGLLFVDDLSKGVPSSLGGRSQSQLPSMEQGQQHHQCAVMARCCMQMTWPAPSAPKSSSEQQEERAALHHRPGCRHGAAQRALPGSLGAWAVKLGKGRHVLGCALRSSLGGIAGMLGGLPIASPSTLTHPAGIPGAKVRMQDRLLCESRTGMPE